MRRRKRRQNFSKEECALRNYRDLSDYEKERFSFLNTSKRIMDNGTSTANQPLNTKVKMEVKLFGSIKERMNSDHHRKIQ